MAKKIIVSAPARIDLSSGWPDSPPYRDDFGGSVLNVAINKRVKVTFDKARGRFTIDDDEVLDCHGLGASGARDSAELVAREKRNLDDRFKLVKNVWDLQNVNVGHRGGCQDQAAAIFGGGNLWYFGPGKIENMEILRTEIPRKFLEPLEKRLVLVNTGEPHFSSNVHDSVFGGENYSRNIPALKRMSKIAVEMSGCLTDDDKIGRLISESWELQKALHLSIETDAMRELQEKYKGKYLACKALGAGGGGFFMFYTTKPKEFSDVAVPFKFDYQGIKIREYD